MLLGDVYRDGINESKQLVDLDPDKLAAEFVRETEHQHALGMCIGVLIMLVRHEQELAHNTQTHWLTEHNMQETIANMQQAISALTKENKQLAERVVQLEAQHTAIRAS